MSTQLVPQNSFLVSGLLIVLCLGLILVEPVVGFVFFVDQNSPNIPGSGTANDPFRLIQLAVNVSYDGCTIIVRNGMYTENIVIDDRDITIQCVDPDDDVVVANTMIIGQQSGSVFTINDSNVVLNGLTITNGLARDGGGINCEGGSLTVKRCLVTNNGTLDGIGDVEGEKDAGYGGGIYIIDSQLNISDSVLMMNGTGKGGDCPQVLDEGGAGGFGGGLYCENTNFEIIDTRISNNTCGNGNKGIMRSGYGGHGGGAYIYNSEGTFTDCQIVLNKAGIGGAGSYQLPNTGSGGGGCGGGVFLEESESIQFDHCVISQNEAGQGENDNGWCGGEGGGIYSKDALVVMSNSQISKNNAGRGVDREWANTYGGDGGGICSRSGAMVLENCQILENKTNDGLAGYDGPHSGSGGGIYANELYMTNCLVVKNSTGKGGNSGCPITGAGAGTVGKGGGVFCHYGEFNRCQVYMNRTGDGGENSPILNYCEAASGGDGAGIAGDTIYVNNCLIAENYTGDAGAMIYEQSGLYISGKNGGFGAGVWGVTVYVTNSTIVNNHCGIGSKGNEGSPDGINGLGGGVYGKDGIITNCIIWGNSYDQVSGVDCQKISYSDIDDMYCNGINGIISVDPLFADADGDDDDPCTVSDNDYHLKSKVGRWDESAGEWVTDTVSSMCINAGNPADPCYVKEPMPHGQRINLGCYGGTEQASKLNSHLVHLISGEHGQISPQNNIYVSDGGSLFITALPWEEYTVGCWIVNGAVMQRGQSHYTLSPVDKEMTVEVQFIEAGELIFVDDDNVDGPWLGRYEYPCKTIQGAVNRVSDGGNIIVMEGTYLENVVIDTKSLSIESSDPYDTIVVGNTVVDGQQSDSVFAINDSEVVLHGLTITHGLARHGGGIHCDGGELMMNRCVVTGNDTKDGTDNVTTEERHAGHGGGLYVNGAILNISESVIMTNITGKGGFQYDEEDIQGGNGGYGAGLYCEQSTITIEDSRISNNSCGNGGFHDYYGGDGGCGGGGYFKQCEISFDDVIIALNYAGNGGGAFDGPGVSGGDGGDGGGFCIVDSGSTVIENSTVELNEAGSGEYSGGGRGGDGGGVYSEDTFIALLKTSIKHNFAGQNRVSEYYSFPGGDGGGVCAKSGVLYLQNCEVISNRTKDAPWGWQDGPDAGSGGGIFANEVYMEESVIAYNYTGKGGDAGCTYYVESAGIGGKGAGVYCNTGNFDRCMIYNNCVGKSGDATYPEEGCLAADGAQGGGIAGGTITLDQCVISQNYSGNAGEFYQPGWGSQIGKNGGNGAGVYGSKVTVKNCTIVGNVCGEGSDGTLDGFDGVAGIGAGVYAGSGSINSSIIWDNTYDQVIGVDCDMIHYSDIDGDYCSGLNGNIFVDPLFADADGADDDPATGADNDYHLQSEYGRWDAFSEMWKYDLASSAGIDSGDPTNELWRGELWPNGRRINMGAYGGTVQSSLSGVQVGIAADVDRDGRVNLDDLMQVSDIWQDDVKLDPRDIDRNGVVDLDDVVIIAQNWLLYDEQGLIGQWTFNDDSGLLANDSSGYGNDGLLVNAPEWGLDVLIFEGGNDYVEINDESLYDVHTGLTLMVWINISSFDQDWPKLIVKPHLAFEDPWEMYCLDLGEDGQVPRFLISDGISSGGAGMTYNDSIELETGRWYFIAGTYDGSVMKLYLDGQVIADSACSLVIGQNDMPLYIGGRGVLNSFNGAIDEVRIYDRALSESDVLQIYELH